MRKVFFAIAVSSILLTSCYTLTHTVGNGGSGGEVVSKKQWYALWGLIPINHVDSKAMAAGATDYTITTKHDFIDLVIGIVTGIVTIQPKTVQVQK